MDELSTQAWTRDRILNELNSLPDPLQYGGASLASVLEQSFPIFLDSLATSQEDMKMWTEYSTGPPRVFPSENCWSTVAPTYREAFSQMLEARDGKDIICQVNGYNSTFSEALMVIQSTDPICPNSHLQEVLRQDQACILNMEPPNRSREHIRLPAAAADIELIDDDHISYGMNLCSYGSFVDIHIDHGQEVLSTLLDRCVKLWLLYPPTPHNLKIFGMNNLNSGRVHRWHSQLEGAVVIVTDRKSTIYLPCGALHATVTIHPGFLVGQDFVTTRTVKTLFHYLPAQIDACPEAIEDEVDIFLKALKSALNTPGTSQVDALEGWISHGPSILRKLANYGYQYQKLIHDALLENLPQDLPNGCPCGEYFRCSVKIHFKRQHL